MNDFEILILGSDANAYTMARCSYEAYHKKAHLIGKERLAFTKYSNILTIDYNENIWDDQVLLQLVNTYAQKYQPKKILLVSTNETYSKFISKNKQNFNANIVYNNQEEANLESLMNKEKFYTTYQNSAFLFPKTLFFDLKEKTYPTIYLYPIIIKPTNVITYNHLTFPKKHKIYKVNNQQELVTTLTSLKKSGYQDKVILQEYIPGDDSHLFDSVVYVDQHHKVKVISFAQIGIQERSSTMVGNAALLINGYSTFLEAPISKMKQTIIKFMEAIAYSGFAEIDMKYDERIHEFKVLEINARQGRSSYYLTKLGANLIQVMVDDLIYTKELSMQELNHEVLLSFVPKKIVKQYLQNTTLKEKALSMWKQRISPLECPKDKNIKRFFLMKRRLWHYRKDYKNAYWEA